MLEDLVIKEEHCAAGIAENILDLFFLQAPHYNFRTGQDHSSTQRPHKRTRYLTGAIRIGQGAARSNAPTGPTLATRLELSDFLASVERRAFRQVQFALRDEDAALDVVQEAMLKLSESYGHRPPEEFPMLFQRILQNAMRDHMRRSKVRNLWVTLLSAFGNNSEDDDNDPLESMADEDTGMQAASPLGRLEQSRTLSIIEAEIAKLPARQREAFLMRYWEEMDIAETAAAMGCSEGSVKTHCSRASHTLAAALRAKGIEL
ncbi:RNA polymerase sigma factor [Uliginosibacterium paludis]|uniref:RNA polymerase sigma factor n=1 Tax=Uliginosibacterium paludis TaxID=1615952 RepID=UPI0036107E45